MTLSPGSTKGCRTPFSLSPQRISARKRPWRLSARLFRTKQQKVFLVPGIMVAVKCLTISKFLLLTGLRKHSGHNTQTSSRIPELLQTRLSLRHCLKRETGYSVSALTREGMSRTGIVFHSAANSMKLRTIMSIEIRLSLTIITSVNRQLRSGRS